MTAFTPSHAASHHPPPAPARGTARRASLYLAASALCLCALAALPLAAQAQVRDFPAAALRGRLTVTAPPQVQLDGKADLLSPGVRIRNTQNLLVMSASLVGQELRVNYVREASTGMLQEVWLLTEAEAALRRPGSERTLFNFLFGSDVSAKEAKDAADRAGKPQP